MTVINVQSGWSFSADRTTKVLRVCHVVIFVQRDAISMLDLRAALMGIIELGFTAIL
jgi:hypothetical protein